MTLMALVGWDPTYGLLGSSNQYLGFAAQHISY